MRATNFLLPTAYCSWCIAISLLLFSCYTPRYVYSPSAHNVPVFTKKGDSKLAFNYSVNIADNTVKDNVSTKQKARGYDIQAAYAVTNNWAVQLNYFNRTERNAGDFDNNVLDSVVVNYKRNLTELGVGYFTSLTDNKKSMLQIFGGVGIGKIYFTDNGRNQNNVYRSRYYDANITKLFIQPVITVGSKNKFAGSFSSRVSFIFFKNIHTDYTAIELDNYKLDSLNYHPSVFWEPAITNTFGFKKLPGIALEFQLGFAFLVSHRFVDYRAFNFSAGLLFDLPKLFAFTNRSSKN